MGVQFGEYHSKVDFNLDYLHKEVTAPKPKTTSVSIPLVNGDIDLTYRLIGNQPVFENRELTFGFEIRSLRAFWMLDYGNLLEKLHGRTMNVICDEDPNWYWNGRVSVGDLEDHGFTAGVTITVDAFPFKWAIQTEDIDTYTLGTAPDPDDYDATFDIKPMIALPEFTASNGGVVITYRDQIFVATGSNYTPPGMLMMRGDAQTMNLYGIGTIDFKIRGGSL